MVLTSPMLPMRFSYKYTYIYIYIYWFVCIAWAVCTSHIAMINGEFMMCYDSQTKYKFCLFHQAMPTTFSMLCNKDEREWSGLAIASRFIWYIFVFEFVWVWMLFPRQYSECDVIPISFVLSSIVPHQILIQKSCYIVACDDVAYTHLIVHRSDEIVIVTCTKNWCTLEMTIHLHINW